MLKVSVVVALFEVKFDLKLIQAFFLVNKKFH